LSANKVAAKRRIGVSEGRQTEAGEHEAQRRSKVVRLPRDWLGPRDELVPFGPRAAFGEPVDPRPDPDDSAPSPSDFWGEQSAAIQSAVQAPAIPYDADEGAAAAHPVQLRRIDRRAAAGVATIVALVAVAVAALVLSSFGHGAAPQPAGSSKAGFAAVLSGGVSSILRLDLARIDAARVASSKVRRAPHRQAAPKPHHKSARSRPAQSVRISPHVVVSQTTTAFHPPPSYTSDATSAGGTDTQSETPPATQPAPQQSASRVASRATVHATGESGALGPIQSPNG
jgi:hypothetical protein